MACFLHALPTTLRMSGLCEKKGKAPWHPLIARYGEKCGSCVFLAWFVLSSSVSERTYFPRRKTSLRRRLCQIPYVHYAVFCLSLLVIYSGIVLRLQLCGWNVTKRSKSFLLPKTMVCACLRSLWKSLMMMILSSSLAWPAASGSGGTQSSLEASPHLQFTLSKAP